MGSVAIQLAACLGARVIATGSEKNHEYLRSPGAEPLSHGEGLTERVRRVAPEGVDVVAGLVVGVLDVTLVVLKDGGRQAPIADVEVTKHGER